MFIVGERFLLSSCLVECLCAQSLSHVLLFATPWTVAHQAPLSVGFSYQEYWSGLSFPPPGDLPDPGITVEAFLLVTQSLKVTIFHHSVESMFISRVPESTESR